MNEYIDISLTCVETKRIKITPSKESGETFQNIESEIESLKTAIIGFCDVSIKKTLTLELKPR